MENDINKDLLDAILNNNYVGMTIVDKNGMILYRNKISEEISGIRNQDVLNRHFSIIPGKGELLEVLRTGTPNLGNVYQTKEGTNAIIHRFPLFKNDAVIGAMTIVTFKDTAEIQDIIQRYHLMKHKLEYYEKELRNLRSAKYNLDNIVGESDKIIYLKKLIAKYAKTNSPILITGKTGTGKELCAHAIHLNSERENGPFVKINCASIPRDLFESEFFGYEPGAFTNASKSGKVGKFELANYGTIFLDEISCLPLEMQPKLLRILQDKEIERIGGNKVIKLDFRLISSTNRDLDLLVRENKFREDLYYRLRVFNLDLPSLRERKEDLPPLCEHFVKLFNEEFGFKTLKIDKKVMDTFHEWHWPGNVRELRNVLERAVNLTETGVIQIKDLPDYLADNPKFISNISKNNQMINLLKEAKNGSERRLLESALLRWNWNKSSAARELGISVPNYML